jgi:hypothetical protein
VTSFRSAGSLVLVDGLDLATVRAAHRRLLDSGRAASPDHVFMVGRRPITDALVDLVIEDEDGIEFVPELDPALVLFGVQGRFRGSPLIAALNYRSEPQLRVPDLDVVPVADPTLVWEALRLQVEGSPHDASLNVLVHGARMAGLGVTITDRSVEADFGDGL